jgi:hypothetical protein
MLFPVGMRVLHDYQDQLKAGVAHPVFNPEKFPDLDIDKTAWKFDDPLPTERVLAPAESSDSSQ